MASLEGNKAFAAILVAGMAFMVAGFVADVLVHPEELEKTAIAIQGASEADSGPARVVIPTILPLLAAASVSNGQATAAQDCGTCHSFNARAAPRWSAPTSMAWSVPRSRAAPASPIRHPSRRSAAPGPMSS